MAPMTHQGRSAPPLPRDAQRAMLALALLLPAGCSSLAGPQDPPAALSADYRTQIATHLRTTFNKNPLTGPAEISEPRWVFGNKGWSWQVCVRFQDRGHQRTYTLFFKGSDFVDERYAVQTDACAAQTYSELDLGQVVTRPGSAGDPGPLY
jgi:hypothetical protein